MSPSGKPRNEAKKATLEALTKFADDLTAAANGVRRGVDEMKAKGYSEVYLNSFKKAVGYAKPAIGFGITAHALIAKYIFDEESRTR